MVSVRTATLDDQSALGRFGGALARQHHAEDRRRFLGLTDPEGPYGRFLVGQIDRPTSTVLVAEHDGAVVGYVWTTIEDSDWSALRGPAGAIQDIFVDAPARRLGAGRALLTAALEWIRAHGRTQVVLMTKTRNENAQHLFTSLGFRPTMIEMTLDLNGEEQGDA